MCCEFCGNEEVLIDIIADAKKRIGKDVEDLNLERFEILNHYPDSLDVKCLWCGQIQNVVIV